MFSNRFLNFCHLILNGKFNFKKNTILKTSNFLLKSLSKRNQDYHKKKKIYGFEIKIFKLIPSVLKVTLQGINMKK